MGGMDDVVTVEAVKARCEAIAERLTGALRNPRLKRFKALRKEGRAVLARVFRELQEDDEKLELRMLVDQERQLENIEQLVAECTGDVPDGVTPLLGYMEMVLFHFHSAITINVLRYTHGAMGRIGRRCEESFDVKEARIDAVLDALSGAQAADGTKKAEVIKGYRSSLLPGSDERALLWSRVK